MASTFSAMSSVGAVVSASHTIEKKSLKSSETLSSFASLSPNALGGRRKNVVLRKRSKVRAMAKDLYFNTDGSAIKKLQVISQENSSFILLYHILLAFSLHPSLIVTLPFHFRQV